MGIACGIANSVPFVGGLKFCLAYNAVHKAFTIKPSTGRAIFYNKAVDSLVDGGYWARIDGLYILCAHTNTNGESLYNWKNPAGTTNATNFNSPIHTPDQGILYNGTTQYTDLNFTPSVNGVNYTQNSATFGLYIRTDITSAGAHGTAGNVDVKDCFAIPRYTDDLAYARINASSSMNKANKVKSDRCGHIFLKRQSIK